MSSLSYAHLYSERDERPCDSCGRRARCAESKRFGGLICGICATGIARAAQRVQPEDGASCTENPPPVRERRGVTQFKGTKRAACSLDVVRELERTYRAFRQFPSSSSRDELLQAIEARLRELAS